MKIILFVLLIFIMPLLSYGHYDRGIIAPKYLLTVLCHLETGMYEMPQREASVGYDSEIGPCAVQLSVARHLGYKGPPWNLTRWQISRRWAQKVLDICVRRHHDLRIYKGPLTRYNKYAQRSEVWRYAYCYAGGVNAILGRNKLGRLHADKAQLVYGLLLAHIGETRGFTAWEITIKLNRLLKTSKRYRQFLLANIP